MRASGVRKAKALVMPSRTDLYFPPEGIEYEVRYMPNAVSQTILSLWGHWGWSGMNPEDAKFIGDSVKEFLSR
jgi:homoserine O-acetyltransferase/O-succinyltransferase